MEAIIHRSEQELLDGLSDVRRSPKDNGTVDAIVIRPGSSERQSLTRCRLSPEGGTDGDAWARNCWLTQDDGSPHPDVQICIMNSRMIQLVAGSRERWELAGDNLFVDFDLSLVSLSAGQQLQVGECILEITSEQHNGCHKFAERYGAAATKVVNSPAGKELRLRGIYARVVQAGIVQVGDRITRIQS